MGTTPYRAVVFDLDGTLLYTLEDLYLATNHALAMLGLPPRSRDEVRQYIGNGYRNLFRLAVPAGSSDELQEQALAIFNAYYLEHSEDHTEHRRQQCEGGASPAVSFAPGRNEKPGGAGGYAAGCEDQVGFQVDIHGQALLRFYLMNHALAK